MSTDDTDELFAGRFRLGHTLGEGGMGTVYDAVEVGLDRPVAVKLLKAAGGRHERARRRFQREAAVAAALKHRNAVEIFGFGEAEGSMWLAMERLRGGTLGETLRADGPLPIPEALHVIREIADVLVAAHDAAMVHRDLKPDNVFLEPMETGPPRVVVVDFGLAFIEDHERLGRVTSQNVVAGSPAYMSPEQARAAPLGPPTDIYSLGCITFEVVTGKPPFPGRGMEVLSRHMYVPPDTMRSQAPGVDIPGALEDLVARLLEKQPLLRPRALEVRDALDALIRTAPQVRGTAARSARDERMVPASAPSGETAESSADGFVFASVGTLDEEALMALRTEGFAVQPVAEARAAARADVVFVADRTLEGLRAFMESMQLFGRDTPPVIADARPGDMERVSALLHLGVADVVMTPCRPSDLAGKARKCALRAQRRRKR